MHKVFKIGGTSRLALVCASVVLLLVACATARSYSPQIDRMKADLAEAKAAGAQTVAPDEYAKAEACLDWWTHYVTQFDHVGDATMANLPARCAAAFQALSSALAASRTARVPVEPVLPPPAPKPEAAPPSGAAAARQAELAAAGAEKGKEPPLKDAFFDFDKSLLRSDAKDALNKNVQWLKENPKATVIIEGHCDERGTQEYNLGLGQRRANAARDYLVAAGIGAKRIKAISYGKERPFVLGHDEAAWKWNRRAHFVLQP